MTTFAAGPIWSEFKENHYILPKARTVQTKRAVLNDVTKLSLSVTHDKDRKGYRATVTIWDCDEHGTWTVTLHTGFRGVQFIPAARFSAKGLQQAWDTVIDGPELAEVLGKLTEQYGKVSA